MNFYNTYKNLNAPQWIQVHDNKKLTQDYGNIYEIVSIIGKRANQIQTNLKEEFLEKKDEFITYTDTVEEFQENQEFIEISSAYERLPHAANMAMTEFLEDKIFYKDPEKENDLLS